METLFFILQDIPCKLKRYLLYSCMTTDMILELKRFILFFPRFYSISSNWICFILLVYIKRCTELTLLMLREPLICSCTSVINTLLLLTYISLMDGLNDGQKCRRLLFFKPLLPAKEHSLDVQLQYNSSFWLREIYSKQSAQSTVATRETVSLKAVHFMDLFQLIDSSGL